MSQNFMEGFVFKPAFVPEAPRTLTAVGRVPQFIEPFDLHRYKNRFVSYLDEAVDYVDEDARLKYALSVRSESKRLSQEAARGFTFTESKYMAFDPDADDRVERVQTQDDIYYYRWT